jgi:hypothetical protein
MKQLWIIVSLTLLSCLPLSVRADSVEGKAIICDEGTYSRGFRFLPGREIEERIIVIIGTENQVHDFNLSKEFGYIWWDHSKKIEWGNWTLDRETLEGTYYYEDGDRTEKNPRTIPCKVYTTSKAYNAEWERLRRERQEKLDGEMEGNQI